MSQQRTPRVGQLGLDEAATREIASDTLVDWQSDIPGIARIDVDPETGDLHIVTNDALLPSDEQARRATAQLAARVGNIEVVLCRQDVDRWNREDGQP